MRILLLVAALFCVSCNALPKDPEGTLDRVRAAKSFRVGLISAEPTPRAELAAAFVARVAAAAGAKAEPVPGAAEPLLSMLEEGEIDLVVGPMTDKSPWMTAVTFLPPLAEDMKGDGHHQLVAMARNGENAWISLLDAQARQVMVK